MVTSTRKVCLNNSHYYIDQISLTTLKRANNELVFFIDNVEHYL